MRDWLPGTAAVEGNPLLPNDLAAGDYSLEAAVIDRGSGLPVVRLAIEGRADSGWYPLSQIKVE